MRKAHSNWLSTVLSVFGGPLFAYLLLRSVRAHARGEIEWKGRTYGGESRGLRVSQSGAPEFVKK